MRYVKNRCIGDHHKSMRVVIKGERTIRVVLSKSGNARWVSLNMLLWSCQWSLRTEGHRGYSFSYTKASADFTAFVRTFSAAASSKWWDERLNILHSFPSDPLSLSPLVCVYWLFDVRDNKVRGAVVNRWKLKLSTRSETLFVYLGTSENKEMSTSLLP